MVSFNRISAFALRSTGLKFGLFAFALVTLLLPVAASAQQTFTGGAIAVGRTQTTSSSNAITISGATGSSIATLKIILNGVTTDGSACADDNCWSLIPTSFYLQSPHGGPTLVLLGGTGDGIDGDDNEDSGSGLKNATITIQDGAGSAPNDVAWAPQGGTFTVKPTSFYVTNSQPPPLGTEADFPQPDGTATLTGKFSGTGISNGDQWTLSIQNQDGYTTPINISSWQMVVTYATTTPTSTAVSSSQNPAFTTSPNNTVTLTATVTPNSGPTGTVLFTDNGNTISGCGAVAVSGGHATCTTTALAQGYHTIEAAYGGGGGYGQSSGSTTELIEVHPSQSGNTWCNNTSFSAPLNGTGIVYPAVIPVSGYGVGSTVGNVTVELENVTEGAAGAGIQAQFLLVAPGGANNLDFLDDAFNVEASAVNLFISDSASLTPTQGTAPINNDTYLPFDGQTSVDTFPASNSPIVDSGIPSVPGTINFAAPHGHTNSFTLQQAFSGAPANGDWALYATASNGSDLLTVGGWCVTLDVNSGVGTTTSLSSSAQRATHGSSVTLTATVTIQGSSTPVTSGTVEFKDETTGNVLASANPLNGSGVASVSVSNLAEGDHKIIASYSGTGGFNTSFSNLYQRIDDSTGITSLGGNQWQFCNAGQITIPMGTSGAETPNPSNIFVSNFPGTLKTATLTLNNFSISQGDQLDNTASLVVGPTGTALDFFSNTADGTIEDTAGAGNYTFADAASALVPSGSGNLTPGTYKPTSYVGTDSGNDIFTADVGGFYTLPGAFGYSASRGTSTFNSEFGGIPASGTWSLYFSSPNANENGSGAAGGWCLNLTANQPTVTVAVPSVDAFTQGGADQKIAVSITNTGTTGPTGDPTGGSNPLTVTDTLNSAFTFNSAGSGGTGWSCSASGQVVSCSNDSAVADNGGTYPQLTIAVNVSAGATGSVTNAVSASGAGVSTTNSNTETIAIDVPPVITSGNSATFTVGTGGSFTVTTTGTPTAAISETGPLPTGVTFIDNGNGTATIAGTPAAGSGGPYFFTITANNGTTNANQIFTLTVNQAPAITSAAGTTFTAGTFGIFTLTATGYPAPAFSETGALPPGVTISSTGVLSGTPAFGTGGSYTITVNATNSVTTAQQTFTLTIQQSPAIISPSAITFTGGTSGTFTVITTGSPTPSIGETGVLPTGVTFIDNGNGTATLSGTPANGGSFPIIITADNGVAPPAIQSFILTVTQYALTTTANPAAGGTVSPVSGSSYNPGTVVGIVATPATGYTFVGWTSTADPVTDSTSASTTITMNGPESVTAQFAPILVVNTPNDDSGTAANCTAQSAPGSNTVDTACSLRDALLNAANSGAGGVTFDSTVFAAPSTITLSNGTLTLPTNTSITGATSGSGLGLTNLVTVDGGGASNNAAVFTVNSSAANATISNLIITDGIVTGPNGGGIVNGYAASLTVVDSTISGNSAPSGTAGIFNDYNATLTIASSTIANNSGGAGGIVNEPGGTINVYESTISGNSATNSGGGIVNDGGTLTIIGGTISGNSAAFDAGGILSNNSGTLNLTDTIVSLNSAPSNPDVDGTVTDHGGNQIGASGIALSPLGSFGGPTQTQIPSPGSPALCGGVFARSRNPLIRFDQRGADDNPSCPDSLDSGAVQTNYAIAFTTQPPANVNGGVPVSPAPVVTLTESGSVFTAATSSVNMTDADSALSGGTNSAALSSGSATFSNLIFSQVETGDTLTASLTLNPNLAPAIVINSAPSTGVTVGGLATMISPTPGLKTILPSTNVTFQWGAGAGVNQYRLDLGTAGPGATDVFTYVGTNTSATVSNIHPTGGTVYARLSSYINGAWMFNDYVYTASPAPVKATLTTPTPGLSTLLGSSNVNFQWTAGTGVSLYQLSLSVIGPGQSELFMFKGAATSATATTLPAKGQIVYARLSSEIGGVWQSNDYQYTESGTTSAALLTSPAPGLGTVLGSNNVTFQWTAGTGVNLYQLNLGSTLGASDLYLYKGTATSTTVPSLPANGQIVYARLYSRINGVWVYDDYQYYNDNGYSAGGTAAAAALQSPTPGQGTVLGTSNVPFQWSTGTGVMLYQLTLSAVTPGASDLFLFKGSATSANVPTLPSNGALVYARLSSYINGAWQHNDYVYSESGSTSAAVLISPTPGLGTILGSSNVQFQWSAGTGVALYQLNLSTVAPGKSELFIYKGSATTTVAPALPGNGVTVYARLYSKINGVWQFNDYVYTESTLF